MKIKLFALILAVFVIGNPLVSQASTQAERDKKVVAEYKAKFKRDRSAHASKQKLAADKAQLREAKVKLKKDRAAK